MSHALLIVFNYAYFSRVSQAEKAGLKQWFNDTAPHPHPDSVLPTSQVA